MCSFISDFLFCVVFVGWRLLFTASSFVWTVGFRLKGACLLSAQLGMACWLCFLLSFQGLEQTFQKWLQTYLVLYSGILFGLCFQIYCSIRKKDFYICRKVCPSVLFPKSVSVILWLTQRMADQWYTLTSTEIGKIDSLLNHILPLGERNMTR